MEKLSTEEWVGVFIALVVVVGMFLISSLGQQSSLVDVDREAAEMEFIQQEAESRSEALGEVQGAVFTEENLDEAE